MRRCACYLTSSGLTIASAIFWCAWFVNAAPAGKFSRRLSRLVGWKVTLEVWEEGRRGRRGSEAEAARRRSA
jgi:hypothetical protein